MGSKKNIVGYFVVINQSNKFNQQFRCPLHAEAIDPEDKDKILAGQEISTFRERIVCEAQGCAIGIEPIEKTLYFTVAQAAKPSSLSHEDRCLQRKTVSFRHKGWKELGQYLAKCGGEVTQPERSAPVITPNSGAPPLEIDQLQEIQADVLIRTDQAGSLQEGDLARLGYLYNPHLNARIQYFKTIPQALALLKEYGGSLRLEQHETTGEVYFAITLKGKPNKTNAA